MDENLSPIPDPPLAPSGRRDDRPHRSLGRLLLGVFIVGLGVIITLRNFGVRFPHEIWLLWPAAIFAVLAANRYQRRGFLDGAGWVFSVLSLFLVAKVFELDEYVPIRKLFPLVLIVIGVQIILRASRGPRPASLGAPNSPDTLNEWVAFGGIDRKVSSQEFRGGSASAFCGGFNIDLRQAKPAGGTAVLDVFAMWGGGEIIVPRDWNVTVKVFPLFAGYEDKTEHPSAPDAATPQLVVTGTLVMGGLEIKN